MVDKDKCVCSCDACQAVRVIMLKEKARRLPYTRVTVERVSEDGSESALEYRWYMQNFSISSQPDIGHSQRLNIRIELRDAVSESGIKPPKHP